MLNKILGGVGRTLITAGTLILLFVAYQLWGTGIQEARSQKELGKEFDVVLEQTKSLRASTTTSTTEPGATTTAGPATTLPALPGALPVVGEPVAKIRIPDIGITRTVVEGITVGQLKRGVGHYPTSPLPGQAGNVAMAGHRTTYGQPFHNVDKLDPGDLIEFETVLGTSTYEVTSLEIVKPHETRILEDFGDNRLTLIACHPKYSLAERIIVHGKLIGNPKPPIKGQEEARRQAGKDGSSDPFAAGSIDGGLSGEKQARTPAILWFLACAGIWLATWLVQTLLRRRMRAAAEDGEKPSRGQRLLTWAPYLVGVPVFLVALYCFFENFSLLLPGNY